MPPELYYTMTGWHEAGDVVNFLLIDVKIKLTESVYRGSLVEAWSYEVVDEEKSCNYDTGSTW